MGEKHRERRTVRLAGRILRTRWIVRTPTYFYKWHLGGLFGGRLLMLEHTGRKTGRARYVVVEIIDRRPDGGFVIVSGFGERAQWYRNAVANPRVRLYLGSHRPVNAVARLLNAGEAAASLHIYAANHPKSWAQLRPVLEDTLGAAINEHGTNLPMMLVTPR